MPLQDGEQVVVKLQSTGPSLPDATIQAAVFEDISPTNSAPDLPAEHGLAGFTASLNDYLGDVDHRRLRQPVVHGVCGWHD